MLFLRLQNLYDTRRTGENETMLGAAQEAVLARTTNAASSPGPAQTVWQQYLGGLVMMVSPFLVAPLPPNGLFSRSVVFAYCTLTLSILMEVQLAVFPRIHCSFCATGAGACLLCEPSWCYCCMLLVSAATHIAAVLYCWCPRRLTQRDACTSVPFFQRVAQHPTLSQGC